MESKERESGDTHDPALLRDLGEDLVLVREVVWDARVLRMSFHQGSLSTRKENVGI